MPQWSNAYLCALVKVPVTILLLACCLCQCLVKPSIVVWYRINQRYITANLCENRARPEVKCHGKCYLKKQLKKAEKASEDNTGKQNTGSGKQWAEISLFIVPDIITITRVVFAQATAQLSFYSRAVLPGIAASVFHPPQDV